MLLRLGLLRGEWDLVVCLLGGCGRGFRFDDREMEVATVLGSSGVLLLLQVSFLPTSLFKPHCMAVAFSAVIQCPLNVSCKMQTVASEWSI